MASKESAYYITWQPDVAEAGHYFLTKVKSKYSDTKSLIELAHKSEGLEQGPYELCSIICAKEAEVIY